MFIPLFRLFCLVHIYIDWVVFVTEVICLLFIHYKYTFLTFIFTLKNNRIISNNNKRENEEEKFGEFLYPRWRSQLWYSVEELRPAEIIFFTKHPIRTGNIGIRAQMLRYVSQFINNCMQE